MLFVVVFVGALKMCYVHLLRPSLFTVTGISFVFQTANS